MDTDLLGADPFVALDGISFVRQRLAGGMRVSPHAHDYAYLTLVLQGGYQGRFGGSVQRGCVAEAVFRPPNQMHELVVGDSGVTLFTITFRADRLPEPLFDAHPLPATGRLSWLLTVIARDAGLAVPDDVIHLEAMACEALAAVMPPARPGGSPPRWLRDARRQVEECPEPRRSLRDLARAVGVHPVHLAASFRRYFDCSVGDFERRQRVTRACLLLATTRMPLADIALETGFADQSHLTHMFRRYTGMTPARFRSAHGGGASAPG